MSSGIRLDLPHINGYALSGHYSYVVHNKLGATWAMTIYYQDLATTKGFTFIAQPAVDVSPWCPASSITSELSEGHRTICLRIYQGQLGGGAAFIHNGVLYSVSPTFAKGAYVPPAATLRSQLIQLIGTVY